jgi:protein-tyrosine phosphatase
MLTTGVGRAGLVACCWLLANGYCKTAIESIAWVRQRRSPRAIETFEQEEFIDAYAKMILQRKKAASDKDLDLAVSSPSAPVAVDKRPRRFHAS